MIACYTEIGLIRARSEGVDAIDSIGILRNWYILSDREVLSTELMIKSGLLNALDSVFSAEKLTLFSL